MSGLRIIPLMLREANDFVDLHHRHSARTSNDGGKYAIGLALAGELVGVAIVGRPVARLLQDGVTAECTRLCVSPAAPKGSVAKLYSRAKRIWQLMGGTRLVTYTLVREGGEAMRGAGLIDSDAIPVKVERWSRKNQRRTAKAIEDEPKLRRTETLAEIPA